MLVQKQHQEGTREFKVNLKGLQLPSKFTLKTKIVEQNCS